MIGTKSKTISTIHSAESNRPDETTAAAESGIVHITGLTGSAPTDNIYGLSDR